MPLGPRYQALKNGFYTRHLERSERSLYLRSEKG